MTAVDIRDLPRALFGSAAALRRDLTGWDAAIRAPRATGRRIGVMQLTAGAGASTVAAAVIRVVASRRPEPVLAIDVSGEGGGLAERLGSGRTPSNDTRAAARTTADALTGLPGGEGWFALNPATPAAEAVGTWLAEAAPIVRFFEVAVTDFGARHPLVDLAACAALSDAVCLVANADREAGELARSVAVAIAGLPEAPEIVIALVDRDRAGPAPARVVAAHALTPTVFVPFDAGLAAGGAPRTAAARRATLELSALLVAGPGGAEQTA